MTAGDPTAAVLIIGNEILSGRTQDVNVRAIAQKLGAIGIPVLEIRIVPDLHDEIIAALNALRARFTYVFTTGGIGPTHDDITVDAVASAFGVSVIEDPKARDLLASHFGEANLTVARLRMARIPKGASLIKNPISAAPGVAIGNVFVMAGVPDIMQGMMDEVVATLHRGRPIYSATASGFVAESVIAEELRAFAARWPHVDIGSYPWVRQQKFGTALVVRGTDRDEVRRIGAELLALIRSADAEATLAEA